MFSCPSLQPIRANHGTVKGVWSKMSKSTCPVLWMRSPTRPQCSGDSLSLSLCHASPLPAVCSSPQCSGARPLKQSSLRLCSYLVQIYISLKTTPPPTLVTLWIPLTCSWSLPDFWRFPVGERGPPHSTLCPSLFPLLSERSSWDIRNTSWYSLRHLQLNNFTHIPASPTLVSDDSLGNYMTRMIGPLLKKEGMLQDTLPSWSAAKFCHQF